MGDHWQHTITLEKTEAVGQKHASLLGGEGACPPEDCGGPTGYEHFKMVLANPGHEEHEDLRNAAGIKSKQKWNPDQFDFEKAAA